MSDKQDSDRADRIVRYKEERKKQLNSEIQVRLRGNENGTRRLVGAGGRDGSSSSVESPRTTRTSRLRMAAQESLNSPSGSRDRVARNDRLNDSPVTRESEKDKSSIRKSNLNRSSNSEVVSAQDKTDVTSRRRRRALSPKSLQKVVSSADNTKINASSKTALSCESYTSSPSSTLAKVNPKKSDLSIHMENARKSVSASRFENKLLGRKSSFSKEKDKLLVKSSRGSSDNTSNSSFDSEKVMSSANKENVKDLTNESGRMRSRSKRYVANTKRLDDLTEVTKQTLARVEKLSLKTRNSPSRDVKPKDSPKSSRNSSVDKSILKKFTEEFYIQPSTSAVQNIAPVSILKRKILIDNKTEPTSHTSPVTFSPSVKEPATTNRKSGILKKRRSLDESLVMRHRSCSPNVANKSDSKSILKNQRRSSMEELTRIQSPEIHIQGILKRRVSRPDNEESSLNSPQGILKRRSGASSAGSSVNTPHVSITTAVILAAARGAEMILDQNEVRPILKKKSFSEEQPVVQHVSISAADDLEPVKPILKKKSFSDEQCYDDTGLFDTPRPILKKKSSTDTDDFDEKPKRPILKSSRGYSSDRDNDGHRSGTLSESDCEVRPILKLSRDESPRPRLSFCEDGPSHSGENHSTYSHRRSDTTSSSNSSDSDANELRGRKRTVSVSELVTNFEKSSSSKTGAIPKRSGQNRNSERYKTQPVTSNEYEASLLYVTIPSIDELPKQYISSPIQKNSDTASSHSLNDITYENNLTVFLSSSLRNASPDSSNCAKMSSDSAFQSLGDGLELEEEEDNQNSEQLSPKVRTCKVKVSHPDLVDDENKEDKSKKHKANSSLGNIKKELEGHSRFSTQPVTFEEVQEAAKITSPQSESEGSDSSSSNKKSILKTSNETLSSHKQLKSPARLKETLYSNNLQKNPLDAPDITCDEGISVNDSGSDSETASGVSVVPLPSNKLKPGKASVARSSSARYSRSPIKSGSDTSEGESSGAREVKSIMRGNLLEIRRSFEGSVPKSRSQNSVRNGTSPSPQHKIHPNVTVRRSNTHSGGMPRMIAELQATLQKKGESEWRKRYNSTNVDDELKLLKEKNKYNDELSEKSILAARKDDLDAASKQWKCRVEKSDAEKFSVAGKMENVNGSVPIQIPISEVQKKVPQAKRFKGKESDSASTPTSPEKNGSSDLKRSQSVHDPNFHALKDLSTKIISKTVPIIQPDDFTFKNFYKSVEERVSVVPLDFALEDFDSITRQSLLVQKKNVQVQKRRGATKNPIKALAQREDIKTEYTEVLTGVAEREVKRLNIEKLAKTSTNFAIEALAGLASKENFKSVALKKGSGPTSLLPFKDLMLLHVKGRRHVQTRLVKPCIESINEGDCYILVTPTAVYNFVGAYSNVIEQNKAVDIANHIQHTCDLGAKVDKVITINSECLLGSRDERNFWQLLGNTTGEKCAGPGNPSEDEIYESNILATNMIYRLENDELAPLEKYWGGLPKHEILTSTGVFVFDYGSEMYVWSGKNASADEKKKTLKLAKDLWAEGFNYLDCNICPLNIPEMLGDRNQENLPKESDKRPDWALFCKITQHRETVLFKEKFLDWPDFSKIIKVRKNEINGKSASYDIRPIDVKLMLKMEKSLPDLIVEGNHLGRGDSYFDEESKRLFEFDSLELKGWRIEENTYEELDKKSLGQFYDAESYIIQWKFKMTVKGRELSGKPSKYAQAGRDMLIYFCWQGANSSINEKGYAALFTVELDNESAPQIRVTQGSEPAVFLRLFQGQMVIHSGKRIATPNNLRLFTVLGDEENELFMVEVPFQSKYLRSRTSFICVNREEHEVAVWHGSKSNLHKKKIVRGMADKLIKNHPPELGLNTLDKIIEINEGNDALLALFEEKSENNKTYFSLLNDSKAYDFTPRFFHFSSVSGKFAFTELLCPYRSERANPFPVLQNEIYSASQPALFLIDNGHELWLWQGWWPDREEEEVELSDQTGSGLQRWQAERRAAMQTCLDYWKDKNSSQNNGSDEQSLYLVWAGLEPLEFQNLFPFWNDRKDVADLNIKDGRIMGEKKDLEQELALLSRSVYPLDELMKRPLPEGVDPTLLENYLSPEDFLQALSISKEEFEKLPVWKQTALKKEKGLF